jgi:hypothetical protein
MAELLEALMPEDDKYRSLADVLYGKTPPPLSGLNPSPFANFLAGGPVPVKGQWYHKKHVALDGYSFIQCHFDECDLYVAKGNFSFERVKLTSCRVIFDKEAYNVVQLLNIFGTEAWGKWPALTPTINPEDHTYTFKRGT